MSRSKSKTLRNHRIKNKVPEKREEKKQKAHVNSESVDLHQVEEPCLTLKDIRLRFPKMHLRDALRKIAEIKIQE